MQIPPQVKYQTVEPGLNQAAAVQAKIVLAPDYTGSEGLVAASTVCGPFLWKQLQAMPAWNAAPGNPVNFRVPGPTSTVIGLGRQFELTDDRLLFEKALRHQLGGDGSPAERQARFSQLRVRRAQPSELSMFWQIFWKDVVEPLLVLETPNCHLMLLFEEGRVVFAEDYFQPDLSVFQPV